MDLSNLFFVLLDLCSVLKQGFGMRLSVASHYKGENWDLWESFWLFWDLVESTVFAKKKQAEVWPTVQSLLTSAWLDLNVLMESKYSMPWVRCAFGNFLFFIPTTSSTVKLENSSLHYLQNNISCRRRPIKVTVQAGRAQPQKDKAWASAIQVEVDEPACDSVCFITNYIKISYSSLPLL